MKRALYRQDPFVAELSAYVQDSTHHRRSLKSDDGSCNDGPTIDEQTDLQPLELMFRRKTLCWRVMFGY